MEAVWQIDRSLTVLVCNLAMIVLAGVFLERKVVKNIAVGSLLLPLLMKITPSFKVTDNELLAVIIGGKLTVIEKPFILKGLSVMFCF